MAHRPRPPNNMPRGHASPHVIAMRLLWRILPRSRLSSRRITVGSSSDELKKAVFRSTRTRDLHAAMRAFRELAASGNLNGDVVSSLLHLCQETRDKSYVEEVIAEARKLPRTDAQLTSKLVNCLVSFGQFEGAWQEYTRSVSSGLRLRSGAVHSLMAAAVTQGQLHSVAPLLRDMEVSGNELEPCLAQELLKIALNLEEKEGRCIFTSLIQLYSSRKEPVPEEVVEPLVEWIDREMGGVKVCRVSISDSGVCSGCQQQLNSELSQDQYLQLLKHAEYSLEKEAASVPSYPGAVDHLRSLLEQHRPFYAVVDGLNMAHRYGHINIKSLKRVCRHLASGGNKLLVIARSHIGKKLCLEEGIDTVRGLKKEYEQRNTHLFFIHNSLADDCYFLFASLYSGPKTLFISNDSMGDHAEKMPSPLRKYFFQWQRRRQVHSEPKLQFPNQLDPEIKWSEHGWHIPVCRRTGSHDWLCVTSDRQDVNGSRNKH